MKSSFDVTLKRMVLRLTEDLDTPRSLGVHLRVKYGCWDELATMRCEPLEYLTAWSYRTDAIAVGLLRKLKDLPTSIDKEAVAIENFWASERLNAKTNSRLSKFLNQGPYGLEDLRVLPIIGEIRKKIARVLGTLPDDLRIRFGKGATFVDRGQLTTVADKMTSNPTFTPSALCMKILWDRSAWARACYERRRKIETVRGNRFTTVDKDAEKDRGICIEPSVNIAFQLALGKLIRARLLVGAGLHLQSLQHRHRRVACEGSLKGDIATIDLSNASDTISKSLVKLLLPSDWWDVLSTVRSPLTLIGGKWVFLEKFSSMGNGYTFELETLVFWAISSVMSGNRPISVYGDDIIVPSDAAESVLTALRFFGLEPNARKTFVTGPFRESCGGDYFMGVDVRPYFLKETPNEPHEWIALANGLYRLGRESDCWGTFDLRLRRAWFCVLDAIPSNIRRCRGPSELGDLVLTDDDSRTHDTRERNGIRYYRVWRPARWKRVSWDHFHPEVVLASALYGAGDERGGMRPVTGITPRDSVAGFKLGWVPRS